MARGSTLPDRAQRLRDLAGSAENIAALAVVADDSLGRARRDLLALAAAGRMLAERLKREADATEVQP